jgi:hypothetical protein
MKEYFIITGFIEFLAELSDDSFDDEQDDQDRLWSPIRFKLNSVDSYQSSIDGLETYVTFKNGTDSIIKKPFKAFCRLMDIHDRLFSNPQRN